MKKEVVMVLFLFLISNYQIVEADNININAENSQLVIYTYESLLADPGYDFVKGFSNYSGIPENEIRLVLLDDANTIVTQAALEKENPVADVLIGIDNVLIHKAKTEQILQQYEPENLINISSDLIQNLDTQNYVVPYDYGIIALWYDNSRINTSSNPELIDITLEDILEYNLDAKLIVEDPTLSSPGLGFLLWTIAVFGDPEISFDGLLNQDWRKWWREASKDLRITPSWGSAFDIFYTEEEGRPIMVSYGTSPAYDVCHPLWGVGQSVDQPSYAIVTHENGSQNAWLQIEGLGITAGAPHLDNAKMFVNWFLGEEVQNNIPLNNWMYPANKNANVSDCFLDVAINPDDVDILNELLSEQMLSENLDQWKSEWEVEIVSFSSIVFLVLTIGVCSLAMVGFSKRKK